MNGRMDGQINDWRPGKKRGDWEGFPWVGTGRQPRDGKLSNSFHRLPEDWSFTRARWAGATGAAWRSSTKPRRKDRAGPYHHPNPPSAPASPRLCLHTLTRQSKGSVAVVKALFVITFCIFNCDKLQMLFFGFFVKARLLTPLTKRIFSWIFKRTPSTASVSCHDPTTWRFFFFSDHKR